MPSERPSIHDLVADLEAAIDAYIPGADARAPVSVLGALAKIVAGPIDGLYAYLAWLAQQMYPSTADIEALREHGRTFGVAEHAASYATGLVVFSGVSGGVIPAATRLRADSGVQYLTDAAIAIVDGAATVPVVAAAPGMAGNLAAGTVVRLVSPIAGVNAAAAVGSAGLSGGADPETTEQYRARVLARTQNAPAGGSEADYKRWVWDIYPSARVWVDRSGGSGIVVRVMIDDRYPGEAPPPEALAPITAYIEERDPATDAALRRPVTADVLVVAPHLHAVDFQVTVEPDTAAVRAAVAAALTEVISAETAPGRTLLRTHLDAAISAAAGEYDHVLIQPAANVTLESGSIAVLGTITWGA